MKTKVEVTAMCGNLKDEAFKLSKNFDSFNEAYLHYNNIVEKYYLNNAEYSDAEMNLEAGGVGYDIRVELIINE